MSLKDFKLRYIYFITEIWKSSTILKTYINFEFVYIVRDTTDFRVQLALLVLPVHRVKRAKEVSRDTLDKRERRETLVPEVTVVYS